MPKQFPPTTQKSGHLSSLESVTFPVTNSETKVLIHQEWTKVLNLTQG